MRSLLPIQPASLRSTLPERVADLVRHRILTLAQDYRPGDRLYPGRLAENLGVSITPIREALKLLAAEGLVDFSPRRGATVIEVTAAELDDLIAVRSGLEVLALRLTGGRFTPEGLSRLSKCLDACERAIVDQDIARYQTHDAEFHRLLVTSSGSSRLLHLYDVLVRQAHMINVQNPQYLEAMRESLEEHRALVGEFAQGNIARSERALEVHWDHSRKRFHRKFANLTRGMTSDTPEPQAGRSTARTPRAELRTRRRVRS
jgi:DNA-binding GntR family transcriptional regulator